MPSWPSAVSGGSDVSVWGTGGPEFESRRSDQHRSTQSLRRRERKDRRGAVRAPSLEPGPQLGERPSPNHVGDAYKQNKTDRHQDIALTGRHRTRLSAWFSQSVLS